MRTAAGIWIVLLGAVVVLAIASVQARGATGPAIHEPTPWNCQPNRPCRQPPPRQVG